MVFRTHSEQAMGLQHRPYIENDFLFVFPLVGAGDWFHSRNVPEPFDIAFGDDRGNILAAYLMTPPKDMIECPEGTTVVYEAKAGNLARWGIAPGAVFALA